MADFLDWRVRKGSSVRRFSDGLVVQGTRPGLLDLSVCRVAGGRPSPAGTGLLAPLTAACTSEGIRRDTGVVSWLCWPNLVTIDGKVVATTSFSAVAPELDGEARVVFDISVDCFASRPADLPPALPTISIFDVLGVEIDVDLLRDKILHAVAWYYAEWERGMHRKLVETIQPTIAWLGQDVEVRTTGGRALRGNAKGLDETGSLLLEQQDGPVGRPKPLAVRPETVELVRVMR